MDILKNINLAPKKVADIVANVVERGQVTRKDIHDLLHHHKEKDSTKKVTNLKAFLDQVPSQFRKENDLEKIADDLDSYKEDYG